jgi:hypothetical protein
VCLKGPLDFPEPVEPMQRMWLCASASRKAAPGEMLLQSRSTVSGWKSGKSGGTGELVQKRERNPAKGTAYKPADDAG